MKKNKGFTLLELLVVIAIITLLVIISASVYMQYRERGRQSAITSYLVQVERVAGLIQTTEHVYDSLCEDDDYKRIEQEIKNINYQTSVFCDSLADRYCVHTEVQEDKSFCFDSVSGFNEDKSCNENRLCE